MKTFVWKKQLTALVAAAFLASSLFAGVSAQAGVSADKSDTISFDLPVNVPSTTINLLSGDKKKTIQTGALNNGRIAFTYGGSGQAPDLLVATSFTCETAGETPVALLSLSGGTGSFDAYLEVSSTASADPTSARTVVAEGQIDEVAMNDVSPGDILSICMSSI
ncbi:MAG: hypothetical protein M3N53_00790 [Actinomycetota bacterium]|nr:hypothetical protein [Actinomycetota bacterium]